MSLKTILPGSTSPTGQQITLGVMGGGQLGRMFVQAAQAMGYFTAVLDPDPASPAGLISHFHIQTPYDDEQGLAQLMQRCEAITTEFENVPSPALVTLGAHRPVAPSASCVAVAQDRIKEKAHFVQCAPVSGVFPAPYAAITTDALLAAVPADLLPGILKTARLGYDGKGQVRVSTREELAAAWASLNKVPCVLEKLMPLRGECSVIVARGADGQTVSFPVQKNTHHDGILAITEVYEGALDPTLAARAQASTVALADHLNYVGVLCVEYFLIDTAHGVDLIVNEMAPRPHNSGHYTQNACDISQFEAQVAQPGHHGQPAGRPLVRAQRRAREGERTRGVASVGAGAGAARHPPAPLRQAERTARPQDGPPQHHRAHRGRGARDRREGVDAARPAPTGSLSTPCRCC